MSEPETETDNRQARREAYLREEARLIILKDLALDVSGTATSAHLERVLREDFMIKRDRDWVHQQLDHLARMGAVALKDAGSVKAVQLLALGRRHVEREVVIGGVRRPSDPEF